MMILLALIPILALLALFLASLAFTTMRANRLAELQGEREQFVQHVVQRDAALQEGLVVALLEGKSFGDALDEFVRQRAALLPGARLDHPAAWDATALDQVARARFVQATTDVTRKLGTVTLVVCVLVVAIAAVSVLVVYHFLPTAGSQPLEQGLPSFPSLSEDRPLAPSPSPPPLPAQEPSHDSPRPQSNDSEEKLGPVL